MTNNVREEGVGVKNMKLLFGTSNPAKILFMQQRLDPLGIEVLSLTDVNAPKIEIDESGNDPLENARIKALAYYQALKMPVFSCDSGLYIDELDEKRQPGLYIRRVQGRSLSDEEMIAHYTSLAEEFGGKLTARYKNAICFVLDESNIYEHMGEDIASEPFFIVSVPHKKRSDGFPLDRLSVSMASGKYYNDLDVKEKYLDDGFAPFFKRALSF